MKNKIGLAVTALIGLVICFISFKLSGHRHSMGALFIGMLFFDYFALLVGVFLHAVRLLEFKLLVVFIGFIALTIFLFIIFNRSQPG